MKNLILTFLVSLLFVSACKQKECNDSTAVNFNQKEECLYCTTEVTTETRTVEVFDTNVNSPFYNQNIADVIFERKFTAQVGVGCLNNYGNNQPTCEIMLRVKNKTSKKISVQFSIEYFLNGNYHSYVFSNSGYYIEPNTETNSTVFSRSICSNLKDATLKATPYSNTYYN